MSNSISRTSWLFCSLLLVGACGAPSATQDQDGAAGAANAAGADARGANAGTNQDAEATANGAGAGGAAQSMPWVDDAVGDDEPVDCTKGGYIQASETWGPVEGCPDGIAVTNDVFVSGKDVVLTIEPGTKLNFETGVVLTIRDQAALSAVGTEQEPILFTGWQPIKGSWGGISIQSASLQNEIRHATIEYAGGPDAIGGALEIDSEAPARLKLTQTTFSNNDRYALIVESLAVLDEFDDNVITENTWAAYTTPRSVPQLSGTNNLITKNGNGNAVTVATGGTLKTETTWPNLSPAVLRLRRASSTANSQVDIYAHLTIEPGTVIELESSGGIEILETSSGLSAVGTAEKPIVFRGVDGASWGGITFYASSWSNNALEYVHIENAGGPVPDTTMCADDLTKSVMLWNISSETPSYLYVANVTFTNAYPVDRDIVWCQDSSVVFGETNVGTADDGSLK